MNKDYESIGFTLDDPDKGNKCLNFIYQNKDTKEFKQVKIASDQAMDDDTLKLLIMLNMCFMKLEKDVWQAVEVGELHLEDYELE